MLWYRIDVQIGIFGESSSSQLQSSREFAKRSDRGALAVFNRLNRQAAKDAKARRLVTKPLAIKRIDVREEATDLTPGGDDFSAESG